MQFIGSAEAYSAVATTNLVASSSLNLQAGDVLTVIIGNTASTSLDDGGSNSFTLLPITTEWWTAQGGYILSATANAAATFSMASPQSDDFGFLILQFRPEAGETVSLGSTAQSQSVWATSISTGLLSTASVNSFFVGSFSISGAPIISAELLAGVATDGSVDHAGFGAHSSYSQFSAAQTNINFTASVSANGAYGADLICFDIAISASASVDDINTSETVLDGEANATFITSGFSGEITTAKLVSGTAETNGTGVTSTGGAGDFDLTDVAAFVVDTIGSPFTSASNAVVARLSDGTDTADLAVTYNPKAGWAVQEITGAVKTAGSIFENFVGTINDASQIYYPTADNTSVDATGIVTTDSTTDIVMQFWDQSDNTWKQLTLLIALARVTSDGSLSWDMLNRIDSDKSLSYNILNRINSDNAASWDLLARIDSDKQLSWNILSSITRVSSDAAISWNLEQRIFSSINLSHDILNAVNSDKAILWNILNRVSSDVSASWDIENLTRVLSDKSIEWNVLSRTNSDVIIQYNIGNLVITTPEGRTLTVAAESRTLNIDLETRSVTVLAN